MKVALTCNYCGNSWKLTVYNLTALDNITCTSCKDSDIVSKKIDDSSSDVFGYNSDAPKKDAWIKK